MKIDRTWFSTVSGERNSAPAMPGSDMPRAISESSPRSERSARGCAAGGRWTPESCEHQERRIAGVYAHGQHGAEVRLAELAAAGRSDREIAERLALTLKTVANHLTSPIASSGSPRDRSSPTCSGPRLDV